MSPDLHVLRAAGDPTLVLLQSGSAVVPPGGSLVLQGLGPEVDAEIRLMFWENEKVEGSTINLTVWDVGEMIKGSPRVLMFNLTNFNNFAGTALGEPVEVSRHGGRPVLFHFAVHAIGEGATATRVVTYTFYLAFPDA